MKRALRETSIAAMDSEIIEEQRPESHGSAPELGFSRSTSGLSTEDTIPIDRTSSDSTIEYLMTAKEIQELDHRLEETVERLQRQREDYEKWETELNQRRLVAYGRLKALGKFHRERMQVYETVKNYLHDMNAASKGRIETPKDSVKK